MAAGTRHRELFTRGAALRAGLKNCSSLAHRAERVKEAVRRMRRTLVPRAAVLALPRRCPKRPGLWSESGASRRVAEGGAWGCRPGPRDFTDIFPWLSCWVRLPGRRTNSATAGKANSLCSKAQGSHPN